MYAFGQVTRLKSLRGDALIIAMSSGLSPCTSTGIVFDLNRRRLTPELHRRRAFTMFEVLLVMAVVVMILGLAWPVLDRYRSEYRLRQGGLLIQSRLSSARVHAIDTGVPYEFRYEPGGQKFLVLPHDEQALHAQQVAGSHGPAKIAGRLPSPQAQFDATAPGASGGQQIPGDWLTGIAAASEFSGATWSAPILFYPDGTAAHATLTIRDKKSQSVTVSVRPLTGAVSVSKIVRGAH